MADQPVGLTALEASFLALERPGLPMHIAAVSVLEPSTEASPPITLEDLRRLIASRIGRVPRFRQRVRFKLFGLARGEWVPVARPELAGHLFHHRLPAPGRRSQLNALCARIQQDLLPRDRPLWQIHLIDGLEGHRQALIMKIHHAITDGIGGMELAEVLLEGRSPGRGGVRTTRRPRLAAPTPTPTRNVWLEGLTGMAFTLASGPIAQASPFNGRVGGRRVFATATLSMDRIRRVKQELGVSIDDVLLASVAGGLRSYFQRHGLAAPRAMKAMIPASTRATSSNAQCGNFVTSVFVDLPLDSIDLATSARRIAVSKAVLRTVHAGLGVSMLIGAAGFLPAPAHDALVRFAGGLPVANLVLSDVPGPDEPRSWLGRRIEACYPMLPLPGAVGVSIAAISMGGTMSVGIVADPSLLPEPDRLARAIEHALNSFEPALPSGVLRHPTHGRARRAA